MHGTMNLKVLGRIYRMLFFVSNTTAQPDRNRKGKESLERP
jgi:hypothetical protein